MPLSITSSIQPSISYRPPSAATSGFRCGVREWRYPGQEVGRAHRTAKGYGDGGAEQPDGEQVFGVDGEVDDAGLIPSRDRIPSLAQILCQILFHLELFVRQMSLDCTNDHLRRTWLGHVYNIDSGRVPANANFSSIAAPYDHLQPGFVQAQSTAQV